MMEMNGEKTGLRRRVSERSPAACLILEAIPI